MMIVNKLARLVSPVPTTANNRCCFFNAEHVETLMNNIVATIMNNIVETIMNNVVETIMNNTVHSTTLFSHDNCVV